MKITIRPTALPWLATVAASRMALANIEAQRPKPKVLIIDDEGPVREVVSLYLEGKDLEVANVRSTDGAKVLVERGQFDLVILDLVLAGARGTELLRLSKSRHPDIPVIIFSRIDLDKACLAGDADAVVRKGGSLAARQAAILDAIARSRARTRNAA